MASVQELLLAAEAKKKVNPLLELLQTGISGYQTGQGIAKTSSDIREKNLDIAIKLIQKQQLEQDIINKQKNQEFLRKQIGLQEEETKNEFNRTSPNPNPTIRSEKLKKKITMNEKGDFEGSFETIEPKEIKYELKEYRDPKDGNVKWGSYDPINNKFITSPNDQVKELAKPVAPKPQTVAEKTIDRVFATDYEKWTVGNGFSDTISQINTLENVAKKLQDPKRKSTLTGPVVSAQPDFTRKRLHPESYEIQQDVEQSVQTSLRQIMGPQFTEKEGLMTLQRGFDPALDEAANAKKVIRLLNKLKLMVKAKQEAIDYYTENGTLSGFKGTLYTVKDGEIVQGSKEDFLKAMELTPESPEPLKTGEKSAEERFAELEKQGMKESDIYETLKKEGY